MTYSWDINEINKINSSSKEILTSELNNEILTSDPILSNSITPLEFRRNYKYYISYLKHISEYLYKAEKHLEYHTLDTLIKRYPTEKIEIKDDLLIQLIEYFIEYLNDDHISSVFNELINPDNHILKISKSDPSNPLCNIINGRCISINDKSYVSIYTKGTIEDLYTIAHEFGHFYAHKLSRGNMTNNFIREFESYYFELLLTDHLNNTLKDDEFKSVIKNNQFTKQQMDVLEIACYDVMVQHKEYLSKDALNELMSERFNINEKLNITPESLYKNNVYNTYVRIHSHLFANSLHELYKDNIKDAINVYKNVILDDNNNFDIFANIYGVTKRNYIKNYLLDYEESKKFQKTLNIR